MKTKSSTSGISQVRMESAGDVRCWLGTMSLVAGGGFGLTVGETRRERDNLGIAAQTTHTTEESVYEN